MTDKEELINKIYNIVEPYVKNWKLFENAKEEIKDLLVDYEIKKIVFKNIHWSEWETKT